MNYMKKNLCIGLVFAMAALFVEQVTDILMATEISRYDLMTMGPLVFEKSTGLHSLLSFVYQDTTSIVYLIIFAAITALVFGLAILFTAVRKNVVAIGLFVVFAGLGANLIDMIVNESHEIIAYIYYPLENGAFLWVNIAQVIMVLGTLVALVGLFIKAKKVKAEVANA